MFSQGEGTGIGWFVVLVVAGIRLTLLHAAAARPQDDAGPDEVFVRLCLLARRPRRRAGGRVRPPPRLHRDGSRALRRGRRHLAAAPRGTSPAPASWAWPPGSSPPPRWSATSRASSAAIPAVVVAAVGASAAALAVLVLARATAGDGAGALGRGHTAISVLLAFVAGLVALGLGARRRRADIRRVGLTLLGGGRHDPDRRRAGAVPRGAGTLPRVRRTTRGRV